MGSKRKRHNQVKPSNKLRRHRKRFTPAEDDFITIHYGSRSLDWVATRLERTPIAIHKRAQALKLGTVEENLEAVSPNMLATIFGVSYNKIYGLMKLEDFPVNTVAYSLKSTTVGAFNPRKYIKVRKFWVWYKDNLERLPLENYEMGSLLPEPEWVRNEKLVTGSTRLYKPWTSHDDFILRQGIKNGDTYNKIAEDLDRTYHAVVGRLRRRYYG